MLNIQNPSEARKIIRNNQYQMQTAGIANKYVQGNVCILPSKLKFIACDLIAISVGWVPTLELFYMAGGKTGYNEERSEILPITSPPCLYVAGRASGTHTLEQQIMQGEQIGLQACSSFIESKKDDFSYKVPIVSDETIRTSMHLSIPSKKKKFVCFCEDVTDQDIEIAVSNVKVAMAQGFN